MRMPFGIREVEVRKADQGHGMFEGAGKAGAEIIFALPAAVLSTLIATFLIGLVLYKLWPVGDEVLGFVLLGAVIIGVFLWARLKYLEAHANLAGVRNSAMVPYRTEQGFGYVGPDGHIYGYSHGVPQLPYETVVEEESTPIKSVDVPATFGDMLREGWTAPGLNFVLGFNEETGQAAELPELTSLGVGGGQGSGKTVDVLSIMLQSVVKYNGRVKFIVIDPHLHVTGDQSLWARVKDLSSFFLCVSDDGSDLERCLGLIESEMAARKAGKTGDVWILVVDEYATLMDGPYAERLVKVLENINGQARKMSMFAVVSSPLWTARVIGGSEMRTTVVTFMLHNMPKSVSELIVPASTANLTSTLDVGEAIFWSRFKAIKVRVPLATQRDIQYILEHYTPGGSSVESSAPIVPVAPLPYRNNGLVVEAGQDQVGQAKRLIIQGLTDIQIAKQVTGKPALRNGALAQEVAWIAQVRREFVDSVGDN